MRYRAIIILLIISLQVNGQGFLKVKGQQIVDGKGNEMILRGIGLGGWMLQEPYMLQLSGVATTQHDIKKKISRIIGRSKTDEFYNEWLKNHCTKGDIDSMAAWGFNSVRLPMHYNLFTLPVEEEPVRGKQTWLNKGFALTDSLLSWCRANRIYLILDLHAAPGGQGNDIAISDRDTTKPSLWQSEANQQKTIALWEKLAKRYSKEEWIGGYDLINETNWGFEDPADKNGTAEKGNVPLKKLLTDITKAIRKVDDRHMIFIEGNGWANNYNGIFPLWDENMVISFHKYWNNNDQASIQKFLDYRERYNVPVWMGESGENSNTWFTDAISLLENHKIGWAWWPLKKAGSNNPLQVKQNEGFQKLIDHWKGNAPQPLPGEAYKSLMQLARSTNIKFNTVHNPVTDAMIRQVGSSASLPFKENIVKPGAVVFAADYDMGRAGIAYDDKEKGNYWVSTTTRTAWNEGGQYRNDGVDIESCNDNISNGYSIGWIADGEWLQYSLHAEKDVVLDINIRTSSKEMQGEIKLLLNENTAAENVSLPVTGGHQQWNTSTIKNIAFKKGWNQFRMLAVKGGFNLNYFQFTHPGTTASIN